MFKFSVAFAGAHVCCQQCMIEFTGPLQLRVASCYLRFIGLGVLLATEQGMQHTTQPCSYLLFVIGFQSLRVVVLLLLGSGFLVVSGVGWLAGGLSCSWWGERH